MGKIVTFRMGVWLHGQTLSQSRQVHRRSKLQKVDEEILKTVSHYASLFNTRENRSRSTYKLPAKLAYH